MSTHLVSSRRLTTLTWPCLESLPRPRLQESASKADLTSPFQWCNLLERPNTICRRVYRSSISACWISSGVTSHTRIICCHWPDVHGSSCKCMPRKRQRMGWSNCSTTLSAGSIWKSATTNGVTLTRRWNSVSWTLSVLKIAWETTTHAHSCLYLRIAASLCIKIQVISM